MQQKTKFKQTEIGMIPEEWDFDELVNHAKIIAGQSPESNYYNSLGEGIPFLQGIRTFGNLYPTYDTWTTRITKLAKRDSVLLSVRAPVGEVNVADKDICIGRGLMSIEGEDNRFIYYLFKAFNDYVINKEKGTVYGAITLEDVKRIKFPLPPLREQHAIVKILSDLDSKIELNQQMNKTLEEIGQAIFKHWFVDFEFPNDEGKPYKSSGGEMIQSELGEIPKGWEVKKICEIAKVSGGKQLSASEIFSCGDIPVFGGAGMMGYTRSHNADGWIITFGRVGAYCGQFFWYLGKAWINNNASLVSPVSQEDSEWLFFLISRIDLGPIKRGAAQPFVSNGDIADLKIAVPLLHFRKAFKDFSNPIFRRLQSSENQSHTLAAIRDFLLPKLMSGKIRVPVENK